MLLGHGEGVLRSAYAVVVGGEGPGIERRSAGVLYLTNHRLVFERSVARGVVRTLVEGAETATVLDAPLAALRDAVVRRPRWGKPRFGIETDRLRVTFDVLEPEAWVEAVATARRAPPAVAPPPGVVVAHTIERQVVKVRCRFCGALGNEVDGRCPSCGAPL